MQLVPLRHGAGAVRGAGAHARRLGPSDAAPGGLAAHAAAGGVGAGGASHGLGRRRRWRRRRWRRRRGWKRWSPRWFESSERQGWGRRWWRRRRRRRGRGQGRGGTRQNIVVTSRRRHGRTDSRGDRRPVPPPRASAGPPDATPPGRGCVLVSLYGEHLVSQALNLQYYKMNALACFEFVPFQKF
jgi:hypothetical protein